MTTATLAAGNRTMETEVSPRRSLEELVDQLMAAMFREEPGDGGSRAERGPQRPRGSAPPAGGRRRHCAGGPVQRGRGEG